MKAKLILPALLFSFCTVLIGCSGDAEDKTSVDPEKLEGVVKDDKTLNAVQLNGSLFSVASPLEAIVSVKKSSTVFNESLLLPVPELSKLTSKFDKAIHLGIVGANLGYASVFDQQLKSIELFKTMKAISTDLDLNDAVPETLIQRLAKNSGNKDSLMVLVSDFYRQANQYLQNNQRMEEAALILAGGWIEGMHFSLDPTNIDVEAIKNRVAGQRSSFLNLKKLIETSSSDELSTALLADLSEIEKSFDGVDYKYDYAAPEHDADSKTTRIKGNTSYSFSDETLEKLRGQISALRTKLTQL